ncbi:DUF3100 domain-containing protein [Moraxella sp. ZY200743]|uniref:DUF3100 domain-containing protein n=1 Tax=Moraxella sp. ZY200743 TaxID=2911970 RepID=UPI003D7E366E
MNQSDGNALDAKIDKVVATLSRKAKEIGSYLSNVTIIFLFAWLCFLFQFFVLLDVFLIYKHLSIFFNFLLVFSFSLITIDILNYYVKINLVSILFLILLFSFRKIAIYTLTHDGETYDFSRGFIADRFGLKTPEGIGVMGVYVMGTLFGAIYFSLMAGVIASWGVFDVRALAMACGVGSGSMMGACSTALAELLPEHKEDIIAFAASSNLLTYATGLFVLVFVALPFAEWLYKVIAKFRKTHVLNAEHINDCVSMDDGEEIKVATSVLIQSLAFICVLLLVVNWVGTNNDLFVALPGMMILFACCVVGILIKKVIPLGVPSIAWVSIVAILVALPAMPMADYVIAATDKLGLLPLITPTLAYAGIAISQSEVALFKKSGVKIAIIALLTFTGTYLGSVAIADWML